MSFNFQGHKVILKPIFPKKVHEDQKTKEKMKKIKKEKINRVTISHLTLQKQSC